MMNLIRKYIRYKVGKKAYRGLARSVGIKKLAGVISIAGGIHHARKH